MFNEFGFGATFYPVINWSPNWTKFQSAANDGHEIGSHTVSHPHLDQLTVEEQNAELKNSQDAINTNIKGQSCLTIAYSYCVPSDDTITSKYYIAARHCQGYTEKSTPDDFLNISSIICGTEGSVKTTENFNSKADAAATSTGWNVYLLHGIDSDGGYSPVTSEVLRESLEFLDDNRDRFWVSSFVNVVRYIRERNAVTVVALESNADSMKVQVTDTLDNAIYNFPVSIRCPLPKSWEYAQAFQEGDSIKTLVKEIESKKYIVFDAVPDEGTISIIAAEIPVVPDLIRSSGLEANAVKLGPNPFNTEINIMTEGHFNYSVHSLDGKLMESGKAYSSEMIGSSLRSGLYIVRIESESETSNCKIIKN
jgi:oligosaccharide reducing-end xylanase